jgi:predicted permease
MEEPINWMAQIAAVIAMQVIGMIYYNPKVLGNTWMRETGITMGSGKGMNMGLIIGITSVFAFLVAFFLTFVVKHGGAEFATFKHGALHGAMFGVMCALPIIGTSALYEQRSWTYILIASGYWVVSCAVMGGIICAWR